MAGTERIRLSFCETFVLGLGVFGYIFLYLAIFDGAGPVDVCGSEDLFCSIVKTYVPNLQGKII